MALINTLARLLVPAARQSVWRECRRLLAYCPTCDRERAVDRREHRCANCGGTTDGTRLVTELKKDED